MRRDEERTQMKKGACWNLVDFIPDLDDAPLGKRGGWTYGSNDISGTTSTASHVVAGVYADFSTGSQNCVLDEDGELYVVSASNVVSHVGSARASVQNPVLHSDLVIIPGADGVSVPKSFDGTSLLNLAGSPPPGKYAAVYKDRTVLAGVAGDLTKSYFSDAANPTSWDTTDSWQSVINPIMGMASLPNALLLFQNTATSRIRGTTPPPESDMIVDDPIFNVGCTDARSIVVDGSICVFANPRGIYLSNGTAQVEDLTKSIGLKRYWQSQLTNYNSSTWTLGAGIHQRHYVIAVMNDDTFVDAIMINIDERRGWRLSNIPAVSFWPAVTIGEELFMGLRSAPRVGKFSTVLLPSSSVKNDADGTSVAPVLETSFFRDKPGKKTWKRGYLTYDMRDAASDNPSIDFGYLRTPEGSYVSAGALAENTDISDPARKTLNVSATGMAFKVQQTNASSATRLYDIMADVHTREGSRVV
jgi:hypothetical protein